MLEPEHRNAHVGIGERGDFGRESVRLMAEDDADGEARLPVEEVHGVNAGLNGGDFVIFGTELSEALRGSFSMAAASAVRKNAPTL
jgi:Arc/MetJ-type ribon-helix-helix transcriptional regulator